MSENEEKRADFLSSEKNVLPPNNYKLKLFIMLSDIWLLLILMYYCIIKNVVMSVRNEDFFWFSNTMISNYVIIGLTIAAAVTMLFFKKTRSIQTRIDKDNQLRQNPKIPVWLTMYDWGWPILFVPTMLFMLLFGIIGLLVDVILPNSSANPMIHSVMGGAILCIGFINAIVAIIKLKPGVLFGIITSLLVILVIGLLQSPSGVVSFFKGIRHIGVKIEPVGYLLLAYGWFFILRLIWVKSLFYYQAITPNRLDEQHGLSESGKGIPRKNWDIEIDTDDVILRFFDIGIIIVFFHEMDKKPIINVVHKIDKKAQYALSAASVTATTH